MRFLTYTPEGKWHEVDPWEILGAEAMVAWDRDIAPLLKPGIREFVLDETQDGMVVKIRGMVMDPESAYSAQAVWRPEHGYWRSTMLGWRPWWLKSILPLTRG